MIARSSQHDSLSSTDVPRRAGQRDRDAVGGTDGASHALKLIRVTAIASCRHYLPTELLRPTMISRFIIHKIGSSFIRYHLVARTFAL